MLCQNDTAEGKRRSSEGSARRETLKKTRKGGEGRKCGALEAAIGTWHRWRVKSFGFNMTLQFLSKSYHNNPTSSLLVWPQGFLLLSYCRSDVQRGCWRSSSMPRNENRSTTHSPRAPDIGYEHFSDLTSHHLHGHVETCMRPQVLPPLKGPFSCRPMMPMIPPGSLYKAHCLLLPLVSSIYCWTDKVV